MPANAGLNRAQQALKQANTIPSVFFFTGLQLWTYVVYLGVHLITIIMNQTEKAAETQENCEMSQITLAVYANKHRRNALATMHHEKLGGTIDFEPNLDFTKRQPLAVFFDAANEQLKQYGLAACDAVFAVRHDFMCAFYTEVHLYCYQMNEQ